MSDRYPTEVIADLYGQRADLIREATELRAELEQVRAERDEARAAQESLASKWLDANHRWVEAEEQLAAARAEVERLRADQEEATWREMRLVAERLIAAERELALWRKDCTIQGAAERQAAERERDELQRSLDICRDDRKGMGARLGSLTAQLAAARYALRRYGKHEVGCRFGKTNSMEYRKRPVAYRTGAAPVPLHPCSCGLDAALNATSGGEGP